MTAPTTTEGLPRLGSGREAEIFAWSDSEVVKLYRDALHRPWAEHERAAMQAARAAGGPVPAAGDIVELNGRPGLVMERADGPDMLSDIERRPWRVFTYGAVMARAHAALHRAQAPASLEPLRERLRRHIETRGVPPTLRVMAVEALAPLPDGDRLCHGDFHPGNLIMTAGGPRVIDWPNAARGDPAGDIARTLMTLRLGEVPPGTPAYIRVLAGIGRDALIRGYRTTCYRQSAVDPGDVHAWMLPVAIHRLTEGIVEERERLVALIERLAGHAPGTLRPALEREFAEMTATSDDADPRT